MRRAAALLACLTALAIPSLAHANWTATGRFTYVDRMYDETGFTGEEPQRSIRFADVDILDSKNKVLATGKTDGFGNFSIFVVDTVQRTVFARVTTRSTRTPDLFVAVQSNETGKIVYYAVKSLNVTNHQPNANLNFGIIAALKGVGGEAFNIFDQLVRGADYIASLRGSRPPAADEMGVVFALNRGSTDSSYSQFTRRIRLRDTGGYDDTVVLHEMGHYFTFEFSANDNPGGSHTFSNCNIDIRLAWDEGFATYWGNSVQRFHQTLGCSIYMRSTGGPGPGNLVRYADLETDAQYFCRGASSEVAIFTSLWDINDSVDTNDDTPGVDDAHDTMALPDAETWQVMRDYLPLPGTANISAEDFWDGWFLAPIANGFLAQMHAIFGAMGIEYREDLLEVNNVDGQASALLVGGAPVDATFFFDPDGDGVGGSAEPDWFEFTAEAGVPYRLETTGLLSDGNTLLELIDTNGVTVLASNNDRVAGDDSSLILWTAPRSDTFHLRVTHAPDFGIYGSYKVSVALQ